MPVSHNASCILRGSQCPPCNVYALTSARRPPRPLAARPGRNETVVAVLGDHGWNLGEGNLFCKMTNTENGVRIPLMFRAPWAQQSAGMRSAELAEAVDLYRTLADLSGVGVETVEADVDGVSL